MAASLASGHLVDAILLLVACEAVGLILWSRRARGAWPLALLCNLGSGAALMLALRGALTGAGWPVIAGCLALAGLAHLTEMALRLGGVAPANPTIRPGEGRDRRA